MCIFREHPEPWQSTGIASVAAFACVQHTVTALAIQIVSDHHACPASLQHNACLAPVLLLSVDSNRGEHRSIRIYCIVLAILE